MSPALQVDSLLLGQQGSPETEILLGKSEWLANLVRWQFKQTQSSVLYLPQALLSKFSLVQENVSSAKTPCYSTVPCVHLQHAFWKKERQSKSAWQHACTFFFFFFLASGPEYVKTWKKAVGQRLMKSGQEVILEVTERMHRGTGDMTTGVPSRAWHSPQIMSAFFLFFNMNHLKTLFWICYNIASTFCFGVLALKNMGS